MTADTLAQFCATCGAPIPAGAAFCARCGKPTVAPAAAAEGPTIMARLEAALQDRYKLQRELGKGGMATVYLAHDLRHDRDVAIKVLHPDLAATVGAERFDREIRLAARLQHPNILTLYDSGNAGTLLYYVMPFVQGESLRDRIDHDKMLPVDEAIRFTIEVAEALGYAHQQGVVHRDIKPENVLIASGHALVADFGIARAVQQAGDDQKLTQTGTAVGTPLYMSPEQAAGEEVGPPSDLYSLACMAYEMLSGQPPFTGANARAIMARHTMEAVPSLQVVRDAVSDEVEDAIHWALAKLPADRPQSAAQFIEALGGAARVSVPAGRAPSRMRMTGVRTTRSQLAFVPWWRRRVVLAAAAVLALAGAGAAVALKGGAAAVASGLDPHDLAVLYFEDRSPGGALAYLADGLTEGLIDALSGVEGLRVITRGGAAQFRGAALSTDSLARALGVGTLVRGVVEPDGDQVRVTVRLYDDNGIERSDATLRQPAAAALVLRDALVEQAARLVRVRLNEQIRVRESRSSTRSEAAWVLLQRAERAAKQMDSAAGAPAAQAALARAADSLALLAEAADDRWIEPILLRGRVAYGRSRRLLDNPLAAAPWIDTGLAHVARAFALDRRHPDALELSGNLRYWRWLLQLEGDPVRARVLLDSARANLEAATTVRSTQAGAWATLSHLYNQVGSASDIITAAQFALAADRFLSNASTIQWRLFLAAYDEGDAAKADQSCREGSRRFPDEVRFTECRLLLLTLRANEPDVPRARQLRDSLLARTAEPDLPYQRLASQLTLAAVMARAGATTPRLADSARTLVAASRGTSDIDPSRDLANISAFVYTLLGDTTQALQQLTTYLAANPGRRAAFATDAGWWFRPLENHPGFRRLVGQPPR